MPATAKTPNAKRRPASKSRQRYTPAARSLFASLTSAQAATLILVAHTLDRSGFAGGKAVASFYTPAQRRANQRFRGGAGMEPLPVVESRRR